MEGCSKTAISRDKSYYFEEVKFIRDRVHGYIYLTRFELELIDTKEFQRLKDIRQLTCQHVYPGARHTRFEHSLGVMHLTKQVLKNLNDNGFIAGAPVEIDVSQTPLINDQLRLNATLAALLHDVGHCPFSHLGESQFNQDEVWSALCDKIKMRVEEAEEKNISFLLDDSTLLQEIEEINKKVKKRPGASHEQMSCLMILDKFYDYLMSVKEPHNSEKHGLYVDFELIIRSILGMKYDTSTSENFRQYCLKNVIINLINSSIFDMDKLDYIMRDAFFTGIGAPEIDTCRLFENMYLYNPDEFNLVFTHRAVPALQNMIEARDELYMYVYNHHSCVFSDFITSYIFRRLTHNARDLINMAKKCVSEEKLEELYNSPRIELSETEDPKDQFEIVGDSINNIGMVPNSYLFSPNAIIIENRSDSDLISLLNIIRRDLERYFEFDSELPVLDGDKATGCGEPLRDYLKLSIHGEISSILEQLGLSLEIVPPNDQTDRLIHNIWRAYSLINSYQRRDFLKPWWKTNFEFTNFLTQNFRDDSVRKRLCQWICVSDKESVFGVEFRSQLAKHVIFITRRLKENCSYSTDLGLLQELKDGEFFVIERSAHFFDPEDIRKLDIALKSNEILGSPGEVKYNVNDYYIKEFTSIIPQRDYYSMYAKNSFYVFSKALPEGLGTSETRARHYQLIEQIFVFISTNLIKKGKLSFRERFCDDFAYVNEESYHEEMFRLFLAHKNIN